MAQALQNEMETWHTKRVEDWTQKEVIAWISSLGPSLKTLKPKFIDFDGSKLLEMSLNDKIPQPMLRKLFKKQLDKIQKQNESFSKKTAQNETNGMKMSWQNIPMNEWSAQMVGQWMSKIFEPAPIPRKVLDGILNQVEENNVTGAKLRNADNAMALRDLLADSVDVFEDHQLEGFKDKVRERVQEEIARGIGDDYDQKDEPFHIVITDADGFCRRIRVCKNHTIKDVAQIYQDEFGKDVNEFQLIFKGHLYKADNKNTTLGEIGVTENAEMSIPYKVKGGVDFEQKDEPFYINIVDMSGSSEKMKVRKSYTIKDVANIYRNGFGVGYQRFKLMFKRSMYRANDDKTLGEIGVSENSELTVVYMAFGGGGR